MQTNENLRKTTWISPSRHPCFAFEDNREEQYQISELQIAFGRFDAHGDPIDVVMKKPPSKIKML
jgi:hypothetical protein